jgi:hypothetical protein
MIDTVIALALSVQPHWSKATKGSVFFGNFSKIVSVLLARPPCLQAPNKPKPCIRIPNAEYSRSVASQRLSTQLPFFDIVQRRPFSSSYFSKAPHNAF